MREEKAIEVKGAHHTEHINGFNAVGNLFGELVLKLVEKSG